MITKEQLNKVAKNLEEFDNAQEALNYLSRTFDLEKTSIKGFIVGPKFREGLVKAIQLLNPPLK